MHILVRCRQIFSAWVPCAVVLSALLFAASGVHAQTAADATPHVSVSSTIPNSVIQLNEKCDEETSTPAGFTHLKRRASVGSAVAEDCMGREYLLGDSGNGVPLDFIKSAFWYRKAAQQGLADAQDLLGIAYDTGQGVPQNYALAAAWFRKAAQQGGADAQFHLSVLYDNGQGVPQDYAQAAVWTRKAALQGDADSQYNLGVDYAQGQGVPQDYAQAAAWYRKAALQGLANAQNNLGRLYDNGQGVPQDYAQAAAWFRKAATQGDAIAQNNLGALYDNGQGSPRNYEEAYFWLDLAAASLHGEQAKKVAQARDAAASHLTPLELTRVQERARRWFASHPASSQ